MAESLQISSESSQISSDLSEFLPIFSQIFAYSNNYRANFVRIGRFFTESANFWLNIGQNLPESGKNVQTRQINITVKTRFKNLWANFV
jgi:hypothetical protein